MERFEVIGWGKQYTWSQLADYGTIPFHLVPQLRMSFVVLFGHKDKQNFYWHLLKNVFVHY